MSVVIPVEAVYSKRDVEVIQKRIKKQNNLKNTVVILKLLLVHFSFSVLLGMLLSNSGMFYYDILIGFFVMTLVVLLINCLTNFRCFKFFFN
jgi:hypothetical protein